jgi:hypothetical protein
MNAVTTGQARDFYRAAASFYRRAPWRSAGADEPIEVECEQVGGGPRFAILLGKKGRVRGMWLCDDWKTCILIERGRYEVIADHLRFTALHFESVSRIGPDDLERAQRHGFEVAGPRAFPAVFHMERRVDLRSPDAGELELLEACLWVIPDFLKRAEDRKPGVYEYAFDGAVGGMTLDLSWVSKGRLSGDRTDGAR